MAAVIQLQDGILSICIIFINFLLSICNYDQKKKKITINISVVHW